MERLQSPVMRQTSLMLLRLTTGFLLFWWGLIKVVKPGLGMTISDTFYGGMFSVQLLLQAFGVVQLTIGLLIAAGLFRRWLYPVLLVITGFSAVAVWYAIIDPFKLWLPPQTGFAFTQLFYPSSIIFAGALTLTAFLRDDTWALDRLRGGTPGRR